MTNAPLPKFCVFCGEKPINKTKEHIIPQWLIKLTGDPNREINLGFNTKVLREEKRLEYRKFAFSSFHFPACDVCNNEFSSLEDNAKPIIEKILERDFLSNQETNILLDWIDKVRIGLWLAALLLDREIAPIDPKFHIKKRIAEKDRCLFVYEMDDDWKGVQFVGFNSPAFLYNPSCFSLCINNFYFFSISIDFLFSRNIGFPFPCKQEYMKNDERILTDLSFGLNRFKLPLLKRNFLKASIELYQPIIFSKLGELIGDSENNPYDSDYVRGNCMDYQKGLGKVFYMEQGKLLVLDDETEICLSDVSNKYDREKFMDKISKQVFDTQLDLTRYIPSTDSLDAEGRKNVRNILDSVIKMQKRFRSLIKNGSS